MAVAFAVTRQCSMGVSMLCLATCLLRMLIKHNVEMLADIDRSKLRTRHMRSYVTGCVPFDAAVCGDLAVMYDG